MKLNNSYCFLFLCIFTVFFFSCVKYTVHHSTNGSYSSLLKNKKIPTVLNKYISIYEKKGKNNKFKRNVSIGKGITFRKKTNYKNGVQIKDKLIKYKTKIITNPLLFNVATPSNYKKCSVRSGRLLLLIKKPIHPNYEIEVTPIYVMLTTDRLILTKDTNKINLIESFELKEIQRIDQNYENTACFDIIIKHIVKKQMKNVELTLCGKNDKEMNTWINSVLEFKNCTIKEIQKVSHKKTVFVDFNNINKLTRIKDKKKLNKYFHISQQKANKRRRHRKINNSLHNSSQLGRITKKEKKRIIVGRFKKGNLNKDNTTKNKFNRHKFLFHKKSRNNLIVNRKIKRRNSFKKKLKTQNKSEKLKELRQLKKIYEDRIRNIKSTPNKRIHLFNNNQSKNKSVCYDIKLSGFKNSYLINKMCNKYYGKFAGDTCKKHENFCIMCCDFHIGSKFIEKRIQCKEKCNRVISKNHKNNGLKWENRKILI